MVLDYLFKQIVVADLLVHIINDLVNVEVNIEVEQEQEVHNRKDYNMIQMKLEIFTAKEIDCLC